jgi:hypothetical protein
MKRLRFVLPALSVLAVALAQGPASPPPAAAPADEPIRSGQWNFELLPRAFQRNPMLDMTVITELTERGKTLPAVSRQAPAYYVLHSSGYHVSGDRRNEKPLAGPEVEAILQHALANAGYLPTASGHPPTLLINYFWGSHNLIDQTSPALSEEQWTNNILERAALAGGEKFANELNRAITRSDAAASTVSSHLDAITAAGAGADSTPILSAASAVAQMNALMNPVRLLQQRSVKNEFLLNQASADCYYVIASAYDFASVATHLKQLLWRTRMTVGTQGVSQTQALPTLIASAAPYFGRDMPEAEVLMKHALPEGKVEIGTPVVVPTDLTPPPAKK